MHLRHAECKFVSVGGSISGGTFTRGRWRKLRHELEREVEAARSRLAAQKQAEQDALAAKRQAEAERRKAAAEAAKAEVDRHVAELRAQMAQQGASAAEMLRKLAADASYQAMAAQLRETQRRHEAAIAAANAEIERQRAIKRAQDDDEEEAIKLLLLHS